MGFVRCSVGRLLCRKSTLVMRLFLYAVSLLQYPSTARGRSWCVYILVDLRHLDGRIGPLPVINQGRG